MVVRILSCAASRSVSTQEQLSESLAAFVRAAVTASLQSLPRMIITSPIKAVSNAPSLQDRCPSPPSPPLTLVLAQSCHTVQAKRKRRWRRPCQDLVCCSQAGSEPTTLVDLLHVCLVLCSDDEKWLLKVRDVDLKKKKKMQRLGHSTRQTMTNPWGLSPPQEIIQDVLTSR